MTIPIKTIQPIRTLATVGFIVGVCVVAAGSAFAVTGDAAVDAIEAQPVPTAMFLVLVLLLQAVSVPSYGRGSVAVSAIGLIAAGIALGAAVAMTIALCAALAQWARSRGTPLRALFDVANFMLAAGGAALANDLISSTSTATGVRLIAASGAGVVYSAVNNGLLCWVIGAAESMPMTAVWQERFRWATPHYLSYGPVALAVVLAWEKVGIVGLVVFTIPPAFLALSMYQYLEKTRAAVAEVKWTNEELSRTNRELTEMADRVHQTHRDTIAALTRTLEAKDHGIAGHSERVASVAYALARRLGYDGEPLDAIEIGALLHDIGKIGVPESILTKPGPLDEREWAVMTGHPLTSEFILTGIDLHPIVLQIVRSTHERLDGTGYPDRLSEDEVPEAARVVLVAEAWDALTTTRPYRAALPPDRALAELETHAGTQFCPRVVAALRTVYREERHLLLGDRLSIVHAA